MLINLGFRPAAPLTPAVNIQFCSDVSHTPPGSSLPFHRHVNTAPEGLVPPLSQGSAPVLVSPWRREFKIINDPAGQRCPQRKGSIKGVCPALILASIRAGSIPGGRPASTCGLPPQRGGPQSSGCTLPLLDSTNAMRVGRR